MNAEAYLVLMLIWCGCGLLYIIGAFIIGIPDRNPPPAIRPPFPIPPKRPSANRAEDAKEESGTSK